MKAFEEWNKKYSACPYAVFAINRKEGWKAALEWVLEELEIEEPFEVFHGRIKEELGE